MLILVLLLGQRGIKRLFSISNFHATQRMETRIISLRFEKRLNEFEYAFPTPMNFPGATF